MIDDMAYRILSGLLFLIPQGIIIITCILYILKETSIEGILLLIGSIIAFLVSIFYQFVYPFLLSENILSSGSMLLFYAVGAISFFGALSFAAGFFMLTRKVLKR
ncbi:hypothetical protein ACJD0Z_08040 [Flavobacteriaceae bacterium M23B6Z8]